MDEIEYDLDPNSNSKNEDTSSDSSTLAGDEVDSTTGDLNNKETNVDETSDEKATP